MTQPVSVPSTTVEEFVTSLEPPRRILMVRSEQRIR